MTANVIPLDPRRPIPCPQCLRDIPRPFFDRHKDECPVRLSKLRHPSQWGRA